MPSAGAPAVAAGGVDTSYSRRAYAGLWRLMKGETAALDYKSVERTIDVLADTVANLLQRAETLAHEQGDPREGIFTVVFPEVPAEPTT